MGPVEKAIRTRVTEGMTLFTAPRRRPFIVKALPDDAVILLFGQQKTRNRFNWHLLESVVPFLKNRGWVEIRSVHVTSGIPGSLDGHLKDNGPKVTSGGYIAAVLEKAGIVDVDLRAPAKVRLSQAWSK